MSSQTSTSAAAGGANPRPAAVTFIKTEHFTLQGARAATIAESTGRATMFLGSVSAGLVALGLIAAATQIGATFYTFGVVVLATLSFVGAVTFERVLQSGLEDHGYAQRIAPVARLPFSTPHRRLPATCSASRRRSGCPSRAWTLGTGRGPGRSPGWSAWSRRCWPARRPA